MKAIHRSVGLMGLVLAVLISPSVSAAQKAVAEVLKDELALMVKECRLTDEQQKVLAEKFKVKQDVLEAWDKTNAEKMTAAQTAAAAARKGTDAEAKKKTNGDLKTLQTEREQSAAEADKAILAALSDEQKSMWAGAQLNTATLGKYKKTPMTEEQSARIKAACLVAAKELAGKTGDDRKDKQGRADIQKCLKWAIDNVILAPVAPPAPPAAKAPDAK